MLIADQCETRVSPSSTIDIGLSLKALGSARLQQYVDNMYFG